MVRRILQAMELSPEDSVLEIGPGKGALTGHLVRRVKKLLLVEKDPALSEEMSFRLQDHDNIEVINQDFLTMPWEEVKARLGENFKVISNLPYQAATAILIRLLKNVQPNSIMVLMFQKEVADRLLGKPHTKDYGSLTIFTQIFARVRVLFEVPPYAFRPPPRVMSTVLKFKLREEALLNSVELEEFESLLRAGFSHRRKMLRQNLRHFFSQQSAQDIEGRLQAVEASPKARAEELSVEQWLKMYRSSG